MPGRAKPGQPKSDAKQTVGTRRGNGAGKGDGLYGPAKGTRTFHKGGPGGPGVKADLVEAKAARNEALKEHIFLLATTASREETQLAAAVAWLDRDEGRPIARTVTTTVDDVSQLSDLELAAEIARLKRELGEDAPRASEAEAGEQAGGVSPIH